VKTFDWVNGLRFDPESSAQERPWIHIAAQLAAVLDMPETPPLTVPIDPAKIATADHPGQPWGLAEGMRLNVALILLELVESKDWRTLGRISERLEAISKNGMPAVQELAKVFCDATAAAEREGRPTTKNDIATKAQIAGVKTPAEKKRGEWFKRYGMEGLPQFRPVERPR
jgi:hypothetical protein